MVSSTNFVTRTLLDQKKVKVNYVRLYSRHPEFLKSTFYKCNDFDLPFQEKSRLGIIQADQFNLTEALISRLSVFSEGAGNIH